MTSYRVHVSTDGVSYSEVDGGTVFTGNSYSDRGTVVFALFAWAVRARYVKLLPQAWYQHNSMRARVIDHLHHLRCG